MAKDPIRHAHGDRFAEQRYRIGRAIAGIRLWRDLTQEGLERATGIDVTRLSRIERGLLNTGVNTYIRIADGLHVPLHWLFTEDWPQYIGDVPGSPSHPPAT